MPYLGAQASAPVSVQRYSITLSADRTSASPGDVITFTAKVLLDSTPVGDKEVRFYVVPPTGLWWIGTVTTDSSGNAVFKWTVPFDIGGTKLPCSRWDVQAYVIPEGVGSNKVTVTIGYRTRISVTVPDKVAVGKPFTVSGRLEYESSSGVWSGLAGRTVSIYYDNNKVADVTTGSDGSFKADVTISSPGTYTIRAVYAGEGVPTVVAVAPLAVVPEQVFTGLAVVLPLIAVAVTVIASELNRGRT